MCKFSDYVLLLFFVCMTRHDDKVDVRLMRAKIFVRVTLIHVLKAKFKNETAAFINKQSFPAFPMHVHKL